MTFVRIPAALIFFVTLTAEVYSHRKVDSSLSSPVEPVSQCQRARERTVAQQIAAHTQVNKRCEPAEAQICTYVGEKGEIFYLGCVGVVIVVVVYHPQATHTGSHKQMRVELVTVRCAETGPEIGVSATAD